jgi:nicotinic acid mononucleotide adenylyltransferase
MDIFSRDVLTRIQKRERGWEKMVPDQVASIIKERHLFGFDGSDGK